MLFLCFLFLLWIELTLGNSEPDALLGFMKGIKEDPTGLVFQSWNSKSAKSDGCPSAWYGIQCIDGRVASITLNDLGLAGSIEFPALVGLKMLRNLSLSNNRFSGILSPDVRLVGSLAFLDLSLNSFHDQMPDELMSLGNLVYLNLSSNNFSGKVPPGIKNLQQLKSLDLHCNSLLGDIGVLFLQMQNLTYVDVSCNRFSGSLDQGIGGSAFVHSVQYLNISHNALVGKIFSVDDILLFDNLEVFDASYNQLVGDVPPFNFLFFLKILNLQSNQLSGSLPKALLQESSMVLSALDLSSNQLQGPVVSITSTTLKYLNLSSNQLSGPLPLVIEHCAIVDLSNNMLSGGVSKIQGWGNYVEVIQLSSNSLTGALPNDTSQFLRLTSFKISNNSLDGTLPVVIGMYPELSTIDLSLNRLNGTLPTNLFTSSKLKSLNLSSNSFTGPIPIHSAHVAISANLDIPLPSIRNTSLESLDLSNNALVGSLPAEIGNMDQLMFLNLSKNNISGQIPREISKLYNLVYIDLHGNQFNGVIPDDLPLSLKYFNVSYNNLSGNVPNNLLRFPDSSFHPGNAFLILPQLPSWMGGSSGIALKEKQRHHMKSFVNATLIASFVGVAALIIILLIVIRLLNIRGKVMEQQRSPLSRLFGVRRSEPSPTSFSQDQLLSSASRSASKHGGVAAATKISAEGDLRSMTKNKSPPKDTGMSSSPSSPPSKDPGSSEHPATLKVCSPDKLAGDLHLFDSSSPFTAERLSIAPAEILGRSCHGTSYKATLDGGHVLTVKWLREGILKGKEFAREAKKLGNIRHPNIVSLRGYYWGPKEHERLIISDYIESLCLASHLYETELRSIPPLSVKQRHKVAIDVARCLNFLHNERAIPHGNLKSTNILLDAQNRNTLLTDYSLHRLLNSAGMADQVLNAGALGYRPPEFSSMNKPCPSLKSDIYAFGVILLEILTGKSACEIVSENPAIVDLTDWVRLLASEKRSIECFDKHISVVGSTSETPVGLEDMLLVALKCILPADERPDIRTVFEELSSIEPQLNTSSLH